MTNTGSRLVGATSHGWMGKRPPRVLMVIENMRLLRTVTRVMSSLGAQSVVAPDIHSVRDLLVDDEEIDLFIYDFESNVNDIEKRDETLAEISKVTTGPAWILLSERRDTERLYELFNLPYKGSVVAKIGELVSSDLLVSARKLLSRELFGIDKYLQWGSVVHSYTVHDSTAREHCQEALEGFLRELSSGSRLRSELVTVADEFLMNALYDAPTDEEGRHISAALSRRQDVTLEEHQGVSFEFGSDGRYVAIGCRDPFGSLSPEKVLVSLARCLRGDEDQIRQDSAGAGIGLYLIYKFVDLLVVNIHESVATEFLGLVDLWSPARKRKLQGKTLNIFNLR